MLEGLSWRGGSAQIESAEKQDLENAEVNVFLTTGPYASSWSEIIIQHKGRYEDQWNQMSRKQYGEKHPLEPLPPVPPTPRHIPTAINRFPDHMWYVDRRRPTATHNIESELCVSILPQSRRGGDVGAQAAPLDACRRRADRRHPCVRKHSRADRL